jgi:hypothetical protein
MLSTIRFLAPAVPLEIESDMTSVLLRFDKTAGSGGLDTIDILSDLRDSGL